MLTNSQILRIDSQTGTDATGEPVFTAGADLTSQFLRCFTGAIQSGQRLQLGATIKDSTQVSYVPKQTLARGSLAAPNAGDRMLIAIDREDPDGTLFQVTLVDDQVKSGGLDHLEIYLRKVG